MKSGRYWPEGVQRFTTLTLVAAGLLLAGMQPLVAQEASFKSAIDPNTQVDNCGPYYIWYQTGPGSYSSPRDYVDLYSITFDISDVVDDFDFVYFTGARAALDTNKDGVSDRGFSRVDENRIIWKPKSGHMRIFERGCWSSMFHEQCGYAMINIQPKGSFKNGNARIPIYVEKKCSPTGVDCSEKLVAFHEFRNCEITSEVLPDFILRSEISKETADSDSGLYLIQYNITVENTTDAPAGTTLTTTLSGDTNVGRFFLTYFNIDCPQNGNCSLKYAENNEFQVEMADIPPHQEIVITYSIGVNRVDIPSDEKSYFTSTATLSTGGSSRTPIGITGTGGRRPERPRQ